WGYWFDPDPADSPEPREKQLEPAEWVEVAPRVWERRVREWEVGRAGSFCRRASRHAKSQQVR
ncbi:MAG: hypothetical protein V3V82_02480, partial [Acidimicrobiia bacterium]